jgi:hypothetical protein
MPTIMQGAFIHARAAFRKKYNVFNMHRLSCGSGCRQPVVRSAKITRFANPTFLPESSTHFAGIPMQNHPTVFPLPNRISATFLMLLTVCGALSSSAAMSNAAELEFAEQELPTRLTVGYAVRLIDMNNDERLDIAIVDSKRILWLENPNWNEHVLIEDKDQTDNVCFAPTDIDGDGQLDFAIGADWTLNTKQGGQIHWIRGEKDPQKKWQSFPIGLEPTVHRMRFADLNGDARPELLVLPLMGRDSTGPEFQESGVRLLSFEIPENPREATWQPTVINDSLHVTHNFWPTDLDKDGKLDLLVVSFEGVTWLRNLGQDQWQAIHVGEGNQKTSPRRGASEIKHGLLAGGKDYIATIEPWHGHQVVVYTRPAESQGDGNEWLWDRHVIDEELQWGHAVWCANLDDDADEELVIGVRDNLDDNHRCGLRIYDPSDDGKTWTRQLVDPGSVAIEDLAVADLNGDGRQDIVAVGRATHNVKIYFNETK